jgi:hypothetical protein
MPHKPIFEEHSTYTRHMQLLPFQGCSQVKILQQLEKITARIQTGVALIHKVLYAICKEFFALLLKSLCHRPLQIISQVNIQPPKLNGPQDTTITWE